MIYIQMFLFHIEVPNRYRQFGSPLATHCIWT